MKPFSVPSKSPSAYGNDHLILILHGGFYLMWYISVSFYMAIFTLGGRRVILGVVATLCHGRDLDEQL